MWCLQHPKIEPHEVFLPQPAKTQPTANYFHFGQRKLAHQRCAKILLTINTYLAIHAKQ